ncbi:hypothetical protein YTPLAS72_02550 [Nitrospira sp.]|nr:hypothetical protein YTPLAS72_02550 [Nitrospira sp.]
MLCGEGTVAVAEQPVAKLVVAERLAGHDLSVGGETSVPQMFDDAQQFARLTRFLVPPDVFP